VAGRCSPTADDEFLDRLSVGAREFPAVARLVEVQPHDLGTEAEWHQSGLMAHSAE
jgi:hypothetical protein